ECGAGEDTCNKNVENCRNTIGSFVCDCKQGLVKDESGQCVDKDECSLNVHKCNGNSKCINTFGSYKCECSEG
ncbi:hypothetical protein PMAYCL1PPCAC_02120, partial [Pristionchus mayeri]